MINLTYIVILMGMAAMMVLIGILIWEKKVLREGYEQRIEALQDRLMAMNIDLFERYKAAVTPPAAEKPGALLKELERAAAEYKGKKQSRSDEAEAQIEALNDQGYNVRDGNILREIERLQHPSSL